jgi:hypothetical protein
MQLHLERIRYAALDFDRLSGLKLTMMGLLYLVLVGERVWNVSPDALVVVLLAWFGVDQIIDAYYKRSRGAITLYKKKVYVHHTLYTYWMTALLLATLIVLFLPAFPPIVLSAQVAIYPFSLFFFFLLPLLSIGMVIHWLASAQDQQDESHRHAFSQRTLVNAAWLAAFFVVALPDRLLPQLSLIGLGVTAYLFWWWRRTTHLKLHYALGAIGAIILSLLPITGLVTVAVSVWGIGLLLISLGLVDHFAFIRTFDAPPKGDPKMSRG